MLKNKELRIPLIIIGTVLIVLISLLIFLVALDQYQRSQPQTKFEKKSISLPFETEVIEDWENFANMPQQIVQPGIEGLIEETWKVVTDKNGVVLSREKVREETITQVQKKIMRKGMLDYEETFNTVRKLSQKTMDLWQQKDLKALFENLTVDDQQRYTAAGLEKIIEDSSFQLDSYVFTGSAKFEHEDQSSIVGQQLLSPPLTTSTTPLFSPTPQLLSSKLYALLPLEYVFKSTLTGGQKLVTNLMVVHESKDVWRIKYPGPTQLITLSSKHTGDDGGKTIGYPLSFEIDLTHALLFTHTNCVYFAYSLENTTKQTKELQAALEDKRKDILALTPSPTPVYINRTPVYPTPDKDFKLNADLEVSGATLKDDPQTAYELLDKTITDKPWSTIPPGESGKGWLKFSPAPSTQIATIILSTRCSIAGLYHTNVTFSTINLH